MSEDDPLRSLLDELGKALSEAIAESPAMDEGLRRLREKGYSLQVLLDCRPSDDPEAEASEAGRTADPRRARRARVTQATFRINGEDLSFLRSIGIDPTRRRRRRNPVE